MQVNSSACFGRTRTVSSSPDRSVPGSSKDSAVSVSSTSTAGDWVSFRLAVSCSRDVSEVSSDSVTLGASESVAMPGAS
ncbi:hypothetical protein MLGJGCBP_04705 [Rhodococcus sp. T7]|nr:hypothetical protein MLGJGCBP_04705 [Rhodococcus sp. T7]